MQRLRPQATLKRRPTNVRVVSADHIRQRYAYASPSPLVLQQARGVGSASDIHSGKGTYGATATAAAERTPLIKAGVKPDIRLTAEDGKPALGLGRMVELGLPLIMSVVT
jgi:hypothetical protein